MSALLKAWSSLNWTAPCSVIACCAPAGAASTETTAAVAMRRALLTAQHIEASLAFLPGAADLKFLQRLSQGPFRNFKSKAAPEPYACQCPFASEVRVRGRCDVSRTSEAGTGRRYY